MNIIVTGASSGIGFEVARNFAVKENNSVLVIARDEKKLLALRQNCVKKFPGTDLHILPFDLENLDEIGRELKESILKKFSTLDILINNAGLLVKKPVMDLTVEDVNRMMSVNLVAPMMLTRALMPLLQKAGGAHVVNIGSMAGVAGGKKFPGLSAYSASKAALHILTECLAEEFMETGVRFNALAFGSVQTEMLEKAFPGLKAPLSPVEMASFVEEFARTGQRYFNGITLPVSVSRP